MRDGFNTRGEIALVVQELVSGLQTAMGYAGAASMSDLWEKASFLMISQYDEAVANPHDIFLPSETERAKNEKLRDH